MQPLQPQNLGQFMRHNMQLAEALWLLYTTATLPAKCMLLSTITHMTMYARVTKFGRFSQLHGSKPCMHYRTLHEGCRNLKGMGMLTPQACTCTKCVADRRTKNQ